MRRPMTYKVFVGYASILARKEAVHPPDVHLSGVTAADIVTFLSFTACSPVLQQHSRSLFKEISATTSPFTP